MSEEDIKNHETSKNSEEDTKQENQHEEQHDHEDHELESLNLPDDFHGHSKKEMVGYLNKIAPYFDKKWVDDVLKDLKAAYEDLYDEEKDRAFNRYKEDGGEPDGFEYKDKPIDEEIKALIEKITENRKAFLKKLSSDKEDNLKRKVDLLEELRQLVEGEESNVSMDQLKKIQDAWKNVGPIPPGKNKDLWASYHALIDRFYDNRSIYFQLKELDRKKNYDSKLQLVESAERLLEDTDMGVALRALHEIHEDYKNIGPAPKEEQEPLWQRLKAASDALYEKKKAINEEFKQKLNENQSAKESLIEKIAPFAEHNSDRINQWTAWTNDILKIQDEWKATGPVPKDARKALTKQFWAHSKAFFKNKQAFFKELEKQRQENLEKKTAICEKAEALKGGEDLDKISKELIDLQKEWKKIGPVPKKFNDSIYERFRSACDEFFDKKRAARSEEEASFEDNLKQKLELCEDLENLDDDEYDASTLEGFLEQWQELGFVPKKDIGKTKDRFNTVVEKFIEKLDATEEEKEELSFKAFVYSIKGSPNAYRIIGKKRDTIRNKIGKIKSDVDTLKTNMSFISSSKNADKLKGGVEDRIEESQQQIDLLKRQLKVLKEAEQDK